MNELDAVKAFRNGDKSAFEFLFNLYYNRLVAYITTFTNDKMNSEDIVQQTFINLWDDRDKLDFLKSPKSYLYAITYNRYIDSIRKKKTQSRLLNSIYERALRDRIEEDNEMLEKRIKKMNSIIDSLPPKCKEIITMNKIQGIKYKDIAHLKGISIKTVEGQMNIAFKKIREGFKEDTHYLKVCKF